MPSADCFIQARWLFDSNGVGLPFGLCGVFFQPVWVLFANCVGLFVLVAWVLSLNLGWVCIRTLMVFNESFKPRWFRHSN